MPSTSEICVEATATPEAESCVIPPLLLQPLVENAVVHGIATLTEGGVARLQAERTGHRIRIVIENPFDPDAPPRPRSGLGLKIVRDRLDSSGTIYEYLDGRTRDRQARVERFQGDPDCRLFLISLKAGGLGLNLTAAEYVFLLDPWWNPAVEAQAMDRAHRIGQTKQIFAYRLIARDTVEEKVLELQQTKLDLATAIIGADNSLIRDLRREDLELLLS